MLNAHNVLQSAFQSAFGTAVATSTVKLQNVSSFKLRPEFQTRALEQLRGTLAPTHQTTLDNYAGSATFEVSDETFEDVNYWLEALFGTASPTGSDPYVRAYAAPLTSAVTPKFMTLQWGQTNGVFQIQDASVASLTLSGADNTGIQVGGSIIGGKVIPGTLASLLDRTAVTRMSGCMASVAIETWTGSTFTPLASSAFSWEISINSNREYRGYLGDCTPTAYHDQKWNGQLRLSLELNDSTDDHLIAMLGASSAILEKQVRIKYSTGSGASLRSMTITFAGHSMQAPELFPDRNGVLTYDLVLDGVYNPTLANWLKIETASETAVLA
ncbi:MAG TPA: hypothetical protein PK273_04005 [Anaerolineaceae bacterium]|nr:hypothetical protein [Anaerolineaceae bacterium]